MSPIGEPWPYASMPPEHGTAYSVDRITSQLARIEAKLDYLLDEREADERSRERMRGFYLTDSQREALATDALQNWRDKKVSMGDAE